MKEKEKTMEDILQQVICDVNSGRSVMASVNQNYHGMLGSRYSVTYTIDCYGTRKEYDADLC